MKRRVLVTALACWPVAQPWAQDEDQRPRQKIPAGELFEALSARFPVRLGLPGFLELKVSAPQLLLLPARNRLGASLLAQAAGPALGRAAQGEVDVLFGLRYEAADQTVRGRDLEILDMRWPGLPRDSVETLRSVVPALAREVVGEVVLHRFSPRELALPDTMGLEPEKLTVVEDGVVVVFTTRRSR